MQHSINPLDLEAFGDATTAAIRDCVHCGLCLTDCPTYVLTGRESESPRGRILMIKQVLEGQLTPEEAAPHIDSCLGCLACEPACPSGVPYREIITPYRALKHPKAKALVDRLAALTLEKPGHFRSAARASRVLKPFRRWLPEKLDTMLDLLPASLPERHKVFGTYPARGPQRGRVALHAGCAQQVLAPEINRATIDVLCRNGIEVVVPENQRCCGSLAWHRGDLSGARRAVGVNLAAFPDDVDAIISTAAGCGSGMQEYGFIASGQANQGVAETFAKKVMDLSQYLDSFGILDLRPMKQPTRIAYQDACHLRSGQRVVDEPRNLIDRIDGAERVELDEAHLCCGSAGTYNIDHPETAETLGRRKLERIREAKVDLVVTANIGCLIQLRRLSETEGGPPIRHLAEIL